MLLLRMSILYEPGRGFNIVVISTLRATGDARFPIRVAMASQWFLSVPLCWLVGVKLQWGLPAIWGVMLGEEWLRGLLMYRRWTKRHWLKHARCSRDQVPGNTLPLMPET